MKIRISALVLVLIITLSFTLSGCAEDGIWQLNRNDNDINKDDIYGAYALPENYTDFAVKLFDNCFDGEENTLVSPLSVALAFAMLAEGAEGETLAEIENTLGMKVSELRDLSYHYIKESLSENPLSTANSLWINSIDNFTVNDGFIESNENYHNAEIFEGKFDAEMVDEINKWVKDNTDDMIDKIIDNLDERAVMCLVNALLFDAKWESTYSENQVNNGDFVTEKVETESVEYMNGTEHYYLDDENCSGFVKYYEGRDYAFVALLPDEDVSVEEYVKTLNGEKLKSLLENTEETTVYTKIPKFDYKTDLSLNAVLRNMGMKKAFDEEQADFSKLGQMNNGNIWIGEVLHSTKITVAEQGTKAGAATAITMFATGASIEQEEPKEVYLERPFVYILMDMENSLPVFIGTVMSVEN